MVADQQWFSKRWKLALVTLYILTSSAKQVAAAHTDESRPSVSSIEVSCASGNSCADNDDTSVLQNTMRITKGVMQDTPDLQRDHGVPMSIEEPRADLQDHEKENQLLRIANVDEVAALKPVATSQATCAAYSCPSGYKKQNSWSTTYTQANCCQAKYKATTAYYSPTSTATACENEFGPSFRAAEIWSAHQQSEMEQVIDFSGWGKDTNQYWVGGKLQSRAWVWLSGHPMEYSNWEPGQGTVKDASQPYLGIGWFGNGKWGDYPSWYRYRVLCEHARDQEEQKASLPLSNGWKAYGSSYGSPWYAVSNGMCVVDGLVKSGGWGHIATLPATCRPSTRLIFDLNNHAESARVDVETNGKITWMAGGKGHSWISLTGITFALS